MQDPCRIPSSRFHFFPKKNKIGKGIQKPLIAVRRTPIRGGAPHLFFRQPVCIMFRDGVFPPVLRQPAPQSRRIKDTTSPIEHKFSVKFDPPHVAAALRGFLPEFRLKIRMGDKPVNHGSYRQ
jgi:hypothetical protein